MTKSGAAPASGLTIRIELDDDLFDRASKALARALTSAAAAAAAAVRDDKQPPAPATVKDDDQPPRSQTPDAAGLLTAPEIASILGVHVNLVYTLAKRGDLPSMKFGGSRRFDRSEVENWLAQHRS